MAGIALPGIRSHTACGTRWRPFVAHRRGPAPGTPPTYPPGRCAAGNHVSARASWHRSILDAVVSPPTRRMRGQRTGPRRSRSHRLCGAGPEPRRSAARCGALLFRWTHRSRGRLPAPLPRCLGCRCGGRRKAPSRPSEHRGRAPAGERPYGHRLGAGRPGYVSIWLTAAVPRSPSRGAPV